MSLFFSLFWAVEELLDKLLLNRLYIHPIQRFQILYEAKESVR